MTIHAEKVIDTVGATGEALRDTKITDTTAVASTASDKTAAYLAFFTEMGQKAKQAATSLLAADTAKKNEALAAIADGLEAHSEAILAANELDMKAAVTNGVPSIMMDRLRLTADRIHQMANGVRQVIDLEDPIGQRLDHFMRPNGLAITKVCVPLGVIAIIYEARPNVTVDAAALTLKTGNAVILRGGKEAMASNRCMVDVIRQSLASVGLPEDAVQLVTITDREAVGPLLTLREYIDVVIPRGGAGLIKRIVTESSIPVIETGSGVVHVFVDESADAAKAVPIVVNAKVQRPSVCNAAETLLVHRLAAPTLLPKIAEALLAKNVRLIGDSRVRSLLPSVEGATEASWATEYNDLIMNVKIVDSIDDAIAHINHYGTKHSECIVTEDKANAAQFQRDVDASTVYVNASTRFTDGFEFGFGAEIGISTQKLHARGPMGLPALTSYKYVVTGDGQVRS